MVQRLTYRRRHSYRTKSNKVRIVKTPGGKLTYLYVSKTSSGAKCGDCGIKLNGIPVLRPRQYSRLSKSRRTVTRAYGGSRCGCCVRNRILRAFLIEEQKIVKKVLKSKSKEVVPAEKPVEKAATPAAAPKVEKKVAPAPKIQPKTAAPKKK